MYLRYQVAERVRCCRVCQHLLAATEFSFKKEVKILLQIAYLIVAQLAILKCLPHLMYSTLLKFGFVLQCRGT